MTRRYDPLDRLLMRAQQALAIAHGPAPARVRPNPAATSGADARLDGAEQRHAAGLMRINHAGEVCAQALYLGQAAVAREASVRADLLAAADEEADHLAWCAERLAELDSGPSRLGLLWFAGSYAIGAGAGLTGDANSLGFIIETERQVEAHLGDHLERLPAGDQRSRAILRQMQEDEARHGEHASALGGRELPEPVPRVMAATAAIMKWLAYRV